MGEMRAEDQPRKYLTRRIDETFLLQERHINDATNVTYIGYADPGVKENESGWLIIKLNYDGNNFMTSKIFADNSTKFNKIWQAYASYDYGG